MSKKSFKTTPKTTPAKQAKVEDFVTGGLGTDRKPANTGSRKHRNTETQKSVKTERTKRLTIDMTNELHTQFKALCAQHGLKMSEEVNRMISARCAQLEKK